MPGYIPGLHGADLPSRRAGPVALHPVAALTFEQLAERWSTQRRSDAIRHVFGCSVTRYVQYLNRKVLDDESAALIAPAVFDRLVRQRDERRALQGFAV